MQILHGHSLPTASNIKQLQVVQNKALRIIGGYDIYTRIIQLHEDLEIPMLQDHLLELSIKFFNSTSSNPNPIIATIGKTGAPSHHLYKLPKNFTMNSVK